MNTTTFQLGPNQKAWIETLRSGKFTQGRQYLKAETTNKEGECVAHCCLGVLFELNSYQTLPLEQSLTNNNYYPFRRKFSGCPIDHGETLTEELCDKYGFYGANGTISNIPFVEVIVYLRKKNLIDVISRIGQYLQIPYTELLDIESFISKNETRHTCNLALLNDSGMSFNDIADFIEAYPHTIFKFSY